MQAEAGGKDATGGSADSDCVRRGAVGAGEHIEPQKAAGPWTKIAPLVY